MLNFRPIEITDKKWIDEIIKIEDSRACEYNFTNMFIWRKQFDTQIEKYGELLLVRNHYDRTAFLFPIGNGDKKSAVEEIILYCKEKGITPIFYGLGEKEKTWFEETYGEKFKITEDRDFADYIYNSADLINLSGKKYHSKRNHIANFKKQDWSFEPMTADNLQEAVAMNDEWCQLNNCKASTDLQREMCSVQNCFEYFTQLDLQGGILKQNSKVVAYTMGQALNSDTYVVFVEKALHYVQGAYPTINQEFAKYACGDFMYINREDDAGDEGLRKAKLSYKPAIILEEYVAEYTED